MIAYPPTLLLTDALLDSKSPGVHPVCLHPGCVAPARTVQFADDGSLMTLCWLHVRPGSVPSIASAPEDTPVALEPVAQAQLASEQPTPKQEPCEPADPKSPAPAVAGLAVVEEPQQQLQQQDSPGLADDPTAEQTALALLALSDAFNFNMPKPDTGSKKQRRAYNSSAYSRPQNVAQRSNSAGKHRSAKLQDRQFAPLGAAYALPAYPTGIPAAQERRTSASSRGTSFQRTSPLPQSAPLQDGHNQGPRTRPVRNRKRTYESPEYGLSQDEEDTHCERSDGSYGSEQQGYGRAAPNGRSRNNRQQRSRSLASLDYPMPGIPGRSAPASSQWAVPAAAAGAEAAHAWPDGTWTAAAAPAPGRQRSKGEAAAGAVPAATVLGIPLLPEDQLGFQGMAPQVDLANVPRRKRSSGSRQPHRGWAASQQDPAAPWMAAASLADSAAAAALLAAAAGQLAGGMDAAVAMQPGLLALPAPDGTGMQLANLDSTGTQLATLDVCEHGFLRHTCSHCGKDTSMCPHGRVRCYCKVCCGQEECKHGVPRRLCNCCTRENYCEHGRRRCYCRECGGASICVHGKRRCYCRECGGSNLCKHGRRRYSCKLCGGKSICRHGRRKSECKSCAQNSA